MIQLVNVGCDARVQLDFGLGLVVVYAVYLHVADVNRLTRLNGSRYTLDADRAYCTYLNGLLNGHIKVCDAECLLACGVLINCAECKQFCLYRLGGSVGVRNTYTDVACVIRSSLKRFVLKVLGDNVDSGYANNLYVDACLKALIRNLKGLLTGGSRIQRADGKVLSGKELFALVAIGQVARNIGCGVCTEHLDLCGIRSWVYGDADRTYDLDRILDLDSLVGDKKGLLSVTARVNCTNRKLGRSNGLAVVVGVLNKHLNCRGVKRVAHVYLVQNGSGDHRDGLYGIYGDLYAVGDLIV